MAEQPIVDIFKKVVKRNIVISKEHYMPKKRPQLVKDWVTYPPYPDNSV